MRTLNEMHTEHIMKFQEKRNELPNMKYKYNKYIKTLNKLNNVKEPTIKINRIRCKLRNKIADLKREIKLIDNDIDKIQYYGKIHTVVKTYMDNIDGTQYDVKSDDDNDNNDDNDNDNDTDKDKDKDNDKDKDKDDNNDDNNKNNDNKDNLSFYDTTSELHKLYLLNKKKNKHKIKRKSKARDTGKKTLKTTSILSHLSGNAIVKEETISNQATLKKKYQSLVDNNYIHSRKKTIIVKICEKCKIEMTIIPSEGSFICNTCGRREYAIMESEIPSHTDSINEKPKYPYKKINHFIEKINQFQSKETNNVPPKIFEIVRNEMKKKRKTKNNITVGFIKDVLKKYKYNNYYENRQYIFSKITGITPPILTREQEDKIRQMFRQLEEPWNKFRPPGRSNFLNYSFVINKILQIIGLYDHAKYFLLLKSDAKLKLQEITWKRICLYLGWPYTYNKDSTVKYEIKMSDLYINDESN
jgi:hypothetical protein